MYYASGTSTDWAYAVANIPFSYMIELRSKQHRFLLPKEEITSTAVEVLNGVKRLMDFVDKKCRSTQSCICSKWLDSLLTTVSKNANKVLTRHALKHIFHWRDKLFSWAVIHFFDLRSYLFAKVIKSWTICNDFATLKIYNVEQSYVFVK